MIPPKEGLDDPRVNSPDWPLPDEPPQVTIGSMTPLMIEHNLRTALAVVRGAAAVMADPRVSKEQWDMAADLMTQGLFRLAEVPGVDISLWDDWDPSRLTPLPLVS